MTDLLIPRYPSISSTDWVGLELVLPKGYRMVAVVDRPDGTTEDLGQNAAGEFRLFRRLTGVLENSHDQRGHPLSDEDLAGFGLSRDQCPIYPDDVQAEGDFSSVVRSNLIGV
jgi:hypothetical protein